MLIHCSVTESLSNHVSALKLLELIIVVFLTSFPTDGLALKCAAQLCNPLSAFIKMSISQFSSFLFHTLNRLNEDKTTDKAKETQILLLHQVPPQTPLTNEV